jgi:hypothetical protein
MEKALFFSSLYFPVQQKKEIEQINSFFVAELAETKIKTDKINHCEREKQGRNGKEIIVVD